MTPLPNPNSKRQAVARPFLWIQPGLTLAGGSAFCQNLKGCACVGAGHFQMPLLLDLHLGQCIWRHPKGRRRPRQPISPFKFVGHWCRCHPEPHIAMIKLWAAQPICPPGGQTKGPNYWCLLHDGHAIGHQGIWRANGGGRGSPLAGSWLGARAVHLPGGGKAI